MDEIKPRLELNEDVKGYPYCLKLPFNHGMGSVMKWLTQHNIDYQWNSYRDEYDDLYIHYYLRDPKAITLLLLKYR